MSAAVLLVGTVVTDPIRVKGDVPAASFLMRTPVTERNGKAVGTCTWRVRVEGGNARDLMQSGIDRGTRVIASGRLSPDNDQYTIIADVVGITIN